MKQICLLFTGLSLALLILFNITGCNNSESSGNTGDITKNQNQPSGFSCVIQKSLPHDTSSFTEGLLVYKGWLYESTGDYGKSKLIKINLSSGKTEKEIRLSDKYFGEGISIVRDTIYQLTYKEHVVFVYDMNFKKIKEFPFDAGEGWGMTTDGTNLIISVGTSDLYYYDPTTFKQIKKITVTDAGALGYNVNELEYIDGYIYANQWQLPYILKIDPATGMVISKCDLTDIWNQVNQKNGNAVPNGIAYDKDSKKIYITGKLWPALYEVKFQ